MQQAADCADADAAHILDHEKTKQFGQHRF
jgi:hypothetical protein